MVAKVKTFRNDDAGFLQALHDGDKYIASTLAHTGDGARVNFHKESCKRWRNVRHINPHPFTGQYSKYTSDNILTLVHHVEQAGLGNRPQFVCGCCSGEMEQALTRSNNAKERAAHRTVKVPC